MDSGIEKRLQWLEERVKHLERLERNTFSALTVNPGDITVSSGKIGIGNGSVYGTTPADIADDTAISFTPETEYGLLIVFHRYPPSSAWGLVRYYAGAASALTNLWTGGSTLEVTTGALTGTTGTDTKFTVSCHTDSKIYLENRTGGALSMHYVILGA